MLDFFIPGLIIAVVGFAAVGLFTRRGGPARAWITATPNRIALLGIAILVLLWVAVALYNEATRAGITGAAMFERGDVALRA